MEVKVTGHSHNARTTLHYLYTGSYDVGQRKYNEAKANHNGIHKRNELIVGYNCHSGYKPALKDFNHYLKQKPDNRVQMLEVVLSFPKVDFDFTKPEDCYEATTIAQNFMSKAFPNHQAIIGLQQDNTNAIPHIHLDINAISMKPPYKTIPGGHSKLWYQKHPQAQYQAVNYGIEHLRHIGNECIADYENDFQRSIMGITKRGQSSKTILNNIQQYIRNSVKSALAQATNKRSLRAVLRSKYNVNASFKHHRARCRRKRGRRSRRTRYKRDGVVFRYNSIARDDNGNPLIRKNGKPRVHRHYLKSSTLARFDPGLSYQNIISTLTQNRERQHQRSEESSSATNQQTNIIIGGSLNLSGIAKSYSASSTSKSQASISNCSSAETTSYVQNQALDEQLSIQREHDEVKADMPRLHNERARQYAFWSILRAIPAYCIDYDKIPVFNINRYDGNLLQRMQSHIIDDFRNLRHRAFAVWKSAAYTAGRFVNNSHVIPSIVRIAEKSHKPTRLAHQFHDNWHRIIYIFQQRIIQPIKTRFSTVSHSASSASVASANASSASAIASASIAHNNIIINSEAKSEADKKKLRSLLSKPRLGMKAVRASVKSANEEPSSERASDSHSPSLGVGAKTRASMLSKVHSHETKQMKINQRHRESERPGWS